MNGFTQVVGRDLRLALRQRADAGMVVLFFVLTAALLPFGVAPEPYLLALMAAGVIWVTALLAVLLATRGKMRLDGLAAPALALTLFAAWAWLRTERSPSPKQQIKQIMNRDKILCKINQQKN